MARVKHATRSAGDGHLLPGLPNSTSRVSKQARVRDVLRNAGRLLKRRKDAEGRLEDLQQEPATPSSRTSTPKERRDLSNEQPVSTRALAVSAESFVNDLRTTKRIDMGYNGLTIHEDDTAPSQHQQAPASQPAVMAEQNPNVQMSGVDQEDEEDEETENEIDETVAEDMRKLEENFKGISQKYRLINRIGEGALPYLEHATLLTTSRHILYCIQG